MYANSHYIACAHSADRTVVAEKPETLMGEPDLCMPPSPQARLAELAACYGNNFQAGVDGKMTLPNFNSRSRPSLHIMSLAAAFHFRQRASLRPRGSRRGPSAWGDSTEQVANCAMLRIKQVDLAQQSTRI